MEGDDVQYAQRLLRDGESSQQVFQRRWYDGPIDGIFGPQTGDACHQAKWELGYEDDNCKKTFGTDLEKLLVGQTKQNEEQLDRAAERGYGNGVTDTIGARAVDWLAQHLGMGESPPGSNCNAFTEWYQQGCEPWCGVAVTRAMVAVGSVEFHKGGFEDYVPNYVRAAEAGDHGLYVVKFADAVKGDLVCFAWDGPPGEAAPGINPEIFDHVGFVLGKTGNGSWTGREGNTSNQLLDTSRSLSQATCKFIRATG